MLLNDIVIQCFSAYENVLRVFRFLPFKSCQCCACSNESKSFVPFSHERPDYRIPRVMDVEKRMFFSCQIVCCNARSSFLYTSFIRNHIFLVKDEDIHCFSAHENAFFEKILKYYIWSSQCSSCSNEAKSFDFFLMKALSIVFLGLCRKTKIFLVKILLQEDNFWYLFAFWTVYCLKMTKIYSASQLIKMRKWENVNMYKLRLL